MIYLVYNNILIVWGVNMYRINNKLFKSFRRIQQLVLKSMVYSDTERNDCPFCQYHLEKVAEDNVTKYLCESCKTLIVDEVCEKTGKKYINKYKNEKWLYYRKKEAALHYRNITKLDEDGFIICPHCNEIHEK